MFTFADVKRRHTSLREFEIVGAINVPFLRPAVWDRSAALALCGGSEHIIDCGETKAQVLDVARFAPNVHAVDVDIGERFLQGLKWMLCIPFRTQQTRFLCPGGAE